MKPTVCNYAVIRFLPYRKTGEFANVGVVVFCPQEGYFDFRVAKEHWRRVHGFFPELERGLYAKALAAVTDELTALREHLGGEARPMPQEKSSMGEIWQELLRIREGVVHLAMPGLETAESPAHALDDLFADFVKRNFAQSREYQEAVMRRSLARTLQRWDMRHLYHEERVGDDRFHVTMPFVLAGETRPLQAIKPLDLDRSESTDIYQHGDRWLGIVRRLRKANQAPDSLIFPVRLPRRTAQLDAAQDIIRELEELDASAVPMDEQDRLRQLLEKGQAA